MAEQGFAGMFYLLPGAGALPGSDDNRFMDHGGPGEIAPIALDPVRIAQGHTPSTVCRQCLEP